MESDGCDVGAEEDGGVSGGEGFGSFLGGGVRDYSRYL